MPIAPRDAERETHDAGATRRVHRSEGAYLKARFRPRSASQQSGPCESYCHDRGHWCRLKAWPHQNRVPVSFCISQNGPCHVHVTLMCGAWCGHSNRIYELNAKRWCALCARVVSPRCWCWTLFDYISTALRTSHTGCVAVQHSVKMENFPHCAATSACCMKTLLGNSCFHFLPNVTQM